MIVKEVLLTNPQLEFLQLHKQEAARDYVLQPLLHDSVLLGRVLEQAYLGTLCLPNRTCMNPLGCIKFSIAR